ncbi:MAG: CPBP family intramembrane metalloprotease [Planctomycetaceae bacterium]|nr:CPBP family intramembrane metalloprotease [Planctomycetaceae bacterium]
MPTPLTQTVDYWSESRRPLASLIFLAPVLAIYELGVLWFDADQMASVRNGADTWLRTWLLQIGFDRPWMLPALIVATLLGWHVLSRSAWRVSVETIVGMLSESLLGAILLLVMGQLLSLLCMRWGVIPVEVVAAALPSQAATAIGFLGAGIYEEVMFRLLLLPTMYCVLRALLIPRRPAVLMAVMLSSTVFSLAHYVEPSGPAFMPSPWAFLAAAEHVLETPASWFGCGFRVLAGVAFATMFLVRGFGITVGCHVLYDLMVGVLILPEHSS